jgi:hypothetical protein
MTWSTWPLILLNYNLPPWLIVKNLFLILKLLISNKESMNNNNTDVYMAPLLEELQELDGRVWVHGM